MVEPVPVRLLHVLSSFTDEVPPHEDPALEWWATDHHDEGVLALEEEFVSPRREVRTFSGTNLHPLNTTAPPKTDHSVFKARLEGDHTRLAHDNLGADQIVPDA